MKSHQVDLLKLNNFHLCHKREIFNYVERFILIYYIPSSKILEFPSVINFDITSNDINFHFHSCRNLGTTFFSLSTYR